MTPDDAILSERLNFEDPYGLTTNPLRLIFMMGAVWRLAQDGCKQIDVLEIGSWCGASALTWGEAMALYTGGGRLICVDPWQSYTDLVANPDELNRVMNDQFGADQAFDVFTSNMAFLPQSVALDVRRSMSRDVLPTFTNASLDLVYIDGDHVHDAVASDIDQSMPLLRDGGILCGDDLELQAYDCTPFQLDQASGVERLWDGPLNDFFHPGVTRAVSERLGRVSSWHGFWAMRKDGDAWCAVSLDGMPMRIPSHLPSKSLMGLKAFLMKNGLI